MILLQSECQLFHSSLEDLKMDVWYHKKQQRNDAKHQPQLVQPHSIGITEPELRAAAGKLAPVFVHSYDSHAHLLHCPFLHYPSAPGQHTPTYHIKCIRSCHANFQMTDKLHRCQKFRWLVVRWLNVLCNAERNALWALGCQMGFSEGAAVASHPSLVIEHTKLVHATALQRVLDKPNLPNSFRKQVCCILRWFQASRQVSLGLCLWANLTSKQPQNRAGTIA